MVGVVERALVQGRCGIETGLYILKVLTAVGTSGEMRQAGSSRDVSIGSFVYVGTMGDDIHSDLPVSSCRRMWLTKA
jgi:hypothetical protein